MPKKLKKRYLDEIMAFHRRRAGSDERAYNELFERALESQNGLPKNRFREPLVKSGLSAIAEIKRKSPSKGELNVDLDPAQLAQLYQQGGASCLSVLTDAEFFGAKPTDLGEAKSSSGLPVLRKDFTVSKNDVCDAALMGADGVLLIMAAISDEEAAEFFVVCAELGLDAVFEIHTPQELNQSLELGAECILVNQRNLKTFEEDSDLAEEMAELLPGGVLKIAASAIRSSDDIGTLKQVNYDAFLVGEYLVRAKDPQAALAELLKFS